VSLQSPHGMTPDGTLETKYPDGGLRMNRKAWLRLLLIATIFFFVPESQSQESAWNAHRRTGVAALMSGHYVEAEKLLSSAVKEAEKFGPKDDRLAMSLNDLGSVYRRQRKYAEAESLYKRALVIWQRNFGPNNYAVATALTNLASLYDEEGKYAEAQPLYERALPIAEKFLGADRRFVEVHLLPMAQSYKKQGKYAEAEPLYKRALEIDEKVLGPRDSNLAKDLDEYAVVLRKTGKPAAADKLEERAKQVRGQ
jgi:tetratricopeptide (TPR) repeat protein